jgi:hypothetical protein
MPLNIPQSQFPSVCCHRTARLQWRTLTICTAVDGYNVPIGLGIWGTAYSESKLVKWASAMESLFKFNEELQPAFVNYNTTKMPFDLRWVSHQFGTLTSQY